MGKRLFPAVQVRNSLKRLVESGAISGCRLQGGCVEEGDGGPEEACTLRPVGRKAARAWRCTGDVYDTVFDSYELI